MKKSIIILLILGVTHSLISRVHKFDKCKAFGSIYFTTNRNEADFIIFIEESEGLADLKVYKTDSPLYATQAGLWYVTDVKPQASYYVYIETERKSIADFTVAYTSNEAFATCE